VETDANVITDNKLLRDSTFGDALSSVYYGGSVTHTRPENQYRCAESQRATIIRSDETQTTFKRKAQDL
jgi:hypothetical protein